MGSAEVGRAICRQWKTRGKTLVPGERPTYYLSQSFVYGNEIAALLLYDGQSEGNRHTGSDVACGGWQSVIKVQWGFVQKGSKQSKMTQSERWG